MKSYQKIDWFQIENMNILMNMVKNNKCSCKKIKNSNIIEIELVYKGKEYLIDLDMDDTSFVFISLCSGYLPNYCMTYEHLNDNEYDKFPELYYFCEDYC